MSKNNISYGKLRKFNNVFVTLALLVSLYYAAFAFDNGVYVRPIIINIFLLVLLGANFADAKAGRFAKSVSLLIRLTSSVTSLSFIILVVIMATDAFPGME